MSFEIPAEQVTDAMRAIVPVLANQRRYAPRGPVHGTIYHTPQGIVIVPSKGNRKWYATAFQGKACIAVLRPNGALGVFCSERSFQNLLSALRIAKLVTSAAEDDLNAWLKNRLDAWAEREARNDLFSAAAFEDCVLINEKGRVVLADPRHMSVGRRVLVRTAIGNFFVNYPYFKPWDDWAKEHLDPKPEAPEEEVVEAPATEPTENASADPAHEVSR